MREFLVQRFSLSELQDIAFDLSINPEEIVRETINAFARGLILYCEHRNQLRDLVDMARRKRPDEHLDRMLAKLPPSEKYRKVEITIPDDGAEVDELEIRRILADKYRVTPDKVQFLALSYGTIRILCSLPQSVASVLVNLGARALEDTPYQVSSVKPFDALDRRSQEAWRYIATTSPMEHRGPYIEPAITWNEALEAVSNKRDAGPRMGIWAALLIILADLCLVFLWLKLGWPWEVIVIPSYLAILAFLTWPDSSGNGQGDRAPIHRSLLIVAVALFLALVITWLVSAVLLSISPDASSSAGKIYDFLFGNVQLVLFWASICGFAVAYLANIFILAPWLARRQDSPSTAAWLHTGQTGKATLTVRAGKLEAPPGTSEAVLASGGPAALTVQEGHVVLLERDGRLSRVVGSGGSQLRPRERVAMIAVLYARREEIELRDIASQDHMLLEVVNFAVLHRLVTGSQQDRRRDGDYSYSEEQVRRIWNSLRGDWRATIVSIAEDVGRDVFGRYSLKELLPLSGSERQKVKDLLKTEINDITLSFGVEIVAVDIGAIRVSEDVERRLNDGLLGSANGKGW